MSKSCIIISNSSWHCGKNVLNWIGFFYFYNFFKNIDFLKKSMLKKHFSVDSVFDKMKLRNYIKSPILIHKVINSLQKWEKNPLNIKPNNWIIYFLGHVVHCS